VKRRPVRADIACGYRGGWSNAKAAFHVGARRPGIWSCGLTKTATSAAGCGATRYRGSRRPMFAATTPTTTEAGTSGRGPLQRYSKAFRFRRTSNRSRRAISDGARLRGLGRTFPPGATRAVRACRKARRPRTPCEESNLSLNLSRLIRSTSGSARSGGWTSSHVILRRCYLWFGGLRCGRRLVRVVRRTFAPAYECRNESGPRG